MYKLVKITPTALCKILDLWPLNQTAITRMRAPNTMKITNGTQWLIYNYKEKGILIFNNKVQCTNEWIKKINAAVNEANKF